MSSIGSVKLFNFKRLNQFRNVLLAIISNFIVIRQTVSEQGQIILVMVLIGSVLISTTFSWAPIQLLHENYCFFIYNRLYTYSNIFSLLLNALP